MHLNPLTVNVKDYNAIGDNNTDNTVALQNAIDSCAKRNGGGTVYIPPGYYVIGTIRFRSNVTLHIDNGGYLVASRNPDVFLDGGKMRQWRLIVADNLENICIYGQGGIIGTGKEDLQRRAGTTYDMSNRPAFRPGGIHFRNCKNVNIRNIRFVDSDNWTLCLDQCRNVRIDGLSIENNYFRTNSDGIDLVSCERVCISNCTIVSGDDGIVLKTLENIPCRDVAVSNCIIESCATGLKLGTESFGNFSDILFSNCIVKNSYGGAGIFIKDGAKAERIKFSHCLFETYEDPYSINLTQSICPIFIDIEKRRDDSKLGQIRDISFQDIIIRSENSVVIQSPESHPIENLTMKGIFLDVTKHFDFSNRVKPAGTIHAYHVDAGTDFVRQEAYIVLANIKGLLLDDIHVRIRGEVYQKTPRHAVYGRGIHNGILRLVRREPSDNRFPDFQFDRCSAIDRC